MSACFATIYIYVYICICTIHIFIYIYIRIYVPEPYAQVSWFTSESSQERLREGCPCCMLNNSKRSLQHFLVSTTHEDSRLTSLWDQGSGIFGVVSGSCQHRMLRGLALRAGLDVMCIQLQGGERLPQHTKASEVLVRLVEHSGIASLFLHIAKRSSLSLSPGHGDPSRPWGSRPT